MKRYELRGRTVVVTGSTGGLGTALAAALHAKGAHLALLDLDQDATTRQAQQLGNPTTAIGLRADVRDLASLEEAMNKVAERFGGIDVVVANAGVDTLGALSTLDPDVFDRTIDINLNGVWRTFRAALPHIEQRRGYLLATSSMGAFVHSPLQSHYAASKAGVWALCDSIRLEVRHLGVGVGSVHPTFFPTPMSDILSEDEAGPLIWGGNKDGTIWKMVPLEKVVSDTVDGIERRAAIVVVPKSNTLIARAPGLFRPLIHRIGFKDHNISQAIELSR